jgi:hypothetical protein
MHHNALMSDNPYAPKLYHQRFIDKYGFDMLDTMLTTYNIVQKFVDHFRSDKRAAARIVAKTVFLAIIS